MRTLFAVCADVHANSVVGLFPPSLTVEGDGSPQTILASAAQRATWKAWKSFWKMMGEKKEEEQAECIVVLVGDILDINLKNPLVLSTANEANVIKLGRIVLSPVIEVADKLFILRGSQNHVGGHAKLEEILADQLAALYPSKLVTDPEASTASWWWCTIKRNGLTIEFAHHSKARAHLPYTMDQMAAREATIVAHRFWKRRKQPPDIAVRAHLHYPADSSRQATPHVLFLPGWTGLPDDYVHQRGGSDELRPVGGLWILAEDGKYQYDFEKWWPKEKRTWTGS